MSIVCSLVFLLLELSNLSSSSTLLRRVGRLEAEENIKDKLLHGAYWINVNLWVLTNLRKLQQDTSCVLEDVGVQWRNKRKKVAKGVVIEIAFFVFYSLVTSIQHLHSILHNTVIITREDRTQYFDTSIVNNVNNIVFCDKVMPILINNVFQKIESWQFVLTNFTAFVECPQCVLKEASEIGLSGTLLHQPQQGRDSSNFSYFHSRLDKRLVISCIANISTKVIRIHKYVAKLPFNVRARTRAAFSCKTTLELSRAATKGSIPTLCTSSLLSSVMKSSCISNYLFPLKTD